MKDKACYCGWCKKETKKVYQLKDRRWLCLECATKHYDCINEKMENYIETIRVSLNKKKDKLYEFKQAECKHENAIDTGYCVGMGDNCRYIWRCNDCGKTIYKKGFTL